MQALVVRSCSNFFFLIWCPRWCYSWKAYPLPHILGMGGSFAPDYWACDWALPAANGNIASPEYIGSYRLALELNVLQVRVFLFLFFFSFTSQDSVLTVAPENFLLYLKTCNNRASEVKREHPTAIFSPIWSQLRLNNISDILHVTVREILWSEDISMLYKCKIWKLNGAIGPHVHG